MLRKAINQQKYECQAWSCEKTGNKWSAPSSTLFKRIPLSNTLHFCPPPLASKTMKVQLNSWKQEHVWSVWSAWFRDWSNFFTKLSLQFRYALFFVCVFFTHRHLINPWRIVDCTDYVVRPWWAVVHGDSWMGSCLSVCWTLCWTHCLLWLPVISFFKGFSQ